MLSAKTPPVFPATSPTKAAAQPLSPSHPPLEKSSLPQQFRPLQPKSDATTEPSTRSNNERMDVETLTMVQNLTQHLATRLGVAAAGFGIASIAVEPLLGASWASGCLAAGIANLSVAGLCFLGSETTKILLDYRVTPPRY